MGVSRPSVDVHTVHNSPPNMPRSRVQQRLSSCSSILLAFILLVAILVLAFFNTRGQDVVITPTPTATPTFISRAVLELAPSPTIPFDLPDLPTFTPTPTITPTPTETPTPTPTPLPTYVAEIIGELVNLRSGPGDDYDVLAIIPLGETVELVGKTADGEWIMVRARDGEEGWIYKDLLQPETGARMIVLTPPPTPTPGPPEVMVELANLRTGPGAVYDLITMLPRGTIFVPEARNQAGDWVFGATSEGQEGWLFTELLSPFDYINSLPERTPPPTPTPGAETPTPVASAPAHLAAPAVANRGDARPMVLANYFAWYDAAGWDACNISAGDRPIQRYHSDDPAAIARHIDMALSAGVDGFTLQWVGPGDRTDRNFAALLNQSAGKPFYNTVVFLRHIWPGATQGNTRDAISHLINNYGGHPNFLRINGRPVIFFTDVYRVPAAGGQSAQQAWASLRAQVDPAHATIWIAEGLDPSFLSVFDGLWVYKIFHAAYPNDYLKAPMWAARARSYGADKLWIATISPGWDDRNAGCRPDIRVPSQPFVKPRNDGATYRATFAAAMQSQPDLLWVNSFNEWVEGTYIEPSQRYGDLYLNLTRKMAAQFKQ